MKSTSVRIAAVSPSRAPGDAIVCFATNGTVSLSKGCTTLGVGIRKGRLDIAAFNRYNSSFGIPVPVGTNGLSLTRIELVTKVGLDGGNVHLGFDAATTADFMILFWDSDADAFRQLCRTGTDLDVSLEDWKSLVGASSDAATAKTPVYVAALGNGSARLVFRYWGVFGGEFVEDEAKQRFTSVDSPIRADVDHDGMIDAADEALSREGRPFRFWLNEDTAKGDYVGQVADDSPNASDLKVNGKLDLVNLFPVEIDLSRFWSEWGMMASVKISSPAGGLRYRVLGGAVASNVWSLATEPLLTNGGEALEEASLTRLTGEGLFPWDDAGLRGRPFVLAFEASERVASGACLNVTLLFDGEEISTFRLPISISSVDDMYRYADLRGAIDNASFAPAIPGEPWNMPDDETDGRHFVFVHGYNVDATSSRKWARAMFKRLWLAGSRSKFTAVDWRGDDSQIPVPTQGDISPNYYVNVKNAFMTAPALASLCGQLPGEKVMLGHSLGNILVSSAAVDHNLEYSKYYMLNAAIPMEAYDEESMTSLMVDGAWKDVSADFRASRFSRLFEQTPQDFRNGLSWRGRFAGILNAINCYSSTEDVLTNPTTNKVFGVESSDFGGAWSKQELFKGCALWYGVNAVTFLGTEIEGGWGINAAYVANPLAYVPLVGLRAGYFEDRTREDMITDPLFTSFDDDRMVSTNVLEIVDDELRAKMLGDAIPAESFAAGANATKGLSGNYNLQSAILSGWPEDRCKKINGNSYPQWRHSDVKDVSFYYVHELFKKITKEAIQ